MNSGIYQIRNLVNDKKYVGRTVDFKTRKKDHFVKLKMGIHCNPKLQNSFNKWGRSNFVFEILEIAPAVELESKEQEYLDTGEFWYNVASSSLGGSFGKVFSKEEVWGILEEYCGNKESIKEVAERHGTCETLVRTMCSGGYCAVPESLLIRCKQKIDFRNIRKRTYSNDFICFFLKQVIDSNGDVSSVAKKLGIKKTLIFDHIYGKRKEPEIMGLAEKCKPLIKKSFYPVRAYFEGRYSGIFESYSDAAKFSGLCWESVRVSASKGRKIKGWNFEYLST